MKRSSPKSASVRSKTGPAPKAPPRVGAPQYLVGVGFATADLLFVSPRMDRRLVRRHGLGEGEVEGVCGGERGSGHRQHEQCEEERTGAREGRLHQ